MWSHSGSHTSLRGRGSARAGIFTQYLREINLKWLISMIFVKYYWNIKMAVEASAPSKVREEYGVMSPDLNLSQPPLDGIRCLNKEGDSSLKKTVSSEIPTWSFVIYHNIWAMHGSVQWYLAQGEGKHWMKMEPVKCSHPACFQTM